MAAPTLLLNETFTGASVPDARAIGLSDACLTAASVVSTPPGGSSNLSNCATHTAGAPTAGVAPGWLQLTDVANRRTGGMVFDRALPSSAGIDVEFDQAQYGGNGADGIGFFLSDGSKVLSTTGALGGSLGYGQGGNGTSPGVAGGYIGVGLDSFGNFIGNFIGDFGGLGDGCATRSPFGSRISNTVTLRGPGNGLTGYCFLTATATLSPKYETTLLQKLRAENTTDPNAAVRNVRVTVSPGSYPTVTVQIDFTGTRTAFQTVLVYTMTDEAPATYKFGFSGSTGDLTDVHLIRNIAINSIDSLGDISVVKQVDNTNPQPAEYAYGEVIPYQFVVTNTGDEAITAVSLTDPLVASISCPTTTLGPAGGATASMVCTGSHVVSGAESMQPTLTNNVGVSALTSTLATVTDTSSATVAIRVSQPRLSLVKSAQLTDGNGDGLAGLGETIRYTFVATNTGNVPLTAVGVTDPTAGPITCTPTALAVGAVANCTATLLHTVTEADILTGGVVNTATGAATPPPGVTPITPPTDTVTTPTVIPIGGLAISKTAQLNDTNSNGVGDVGETINYSFLLTNTGNVTLTGVGVNDPTAGAVTCVATTLAPAGTTTCTANTAHTITEADLLAGGVVNTATGQGTTPPGVPAIIPPTDTETTPTVNVTAAMSLAKVANLNDTNGNNLADPGETIDYSFTLVNVGNVTLTAVGVTDPKAGAVTCLAVVLAPGASTTCASVGSYTVTEADVLANGVTNIATGVATPPPGTPFVPPTATVTTPTPPSVGGLSMRKTGSLNDTNSNGLADIGETIDYSFLMTNTGNVTLTGISVDDPKAGAVTCPTTTLAPGATTVCTTDTPYTALEDDELLGAVQNIATGNASVPPGVPPITPPVEIVTIPTPIAGAGLALAKADALNDGNSNGLADLGETINYTFVLTNTGNVTLTGVDISDPKVGDVTCPSATLAIGASMTCTADNPYTVTEADILANGVVNLATGEASPPPNIGLIPPTDTITTPTPTPAAGLALTKTAALTDTNNNGFASIGESVEYTITLTNISNVTLTAVGVNDPTAGPVTCLVTTLAPGESTTCTPDSPRTVTQADILGGAVINVATGEGTPPPGVNPIVPPVGTASVPTATPAPALSIVKSATLNDSNGDGLADAGETVDYSFALSNTGDVTLSDLAITDVKAGTVICLTTTLDPGESTTCTAVTPYTVVEADILAGGVINTATGNATTPPGAPDLVPPTDTVTVPTSPAAGGYSIVKSATLNDANGDGLADLGETINFSFVLRNLGNVTLTGVGVNDPKAGQVTCPSTVLAPGAELICTAAPYTVTEADVIAENVVNTATGLAVVPPGVPVDPLDPPTDTTTTPTALPDPGLTNVKTAKLNDSNGNGYADIGETVDYAIRLENIGNVTLSQVVVTDPIVGLVSCPAETLAPRASMVCTTPSYTVTAADIAQGNTWNIATATAITPETVPPLLPVVDTAGVTAPPIVFGTDNKLPNTGLNLFGSATVVLGAGLGAVIVGLMLVRRRKRFSTV